MAKLIRVKKKTPETPSLYQPVSDVSEFIEKKKMFTLDPAVMREFQYDQTTDEMLVNNIADDGMFMSFPLYLMNATAMCYPGLKDSIVKGDVNDDQTSLVATTISSVGYVAKSRLHYLILGAMYDAKNYILTTALGAPTVQDITNKTKDPKITITPDERARYDKAYQQFSEKINRAFHAATDGLVRYLFEAIPVESLGDDDIIMFNCITECMAVLSADIYDCASDLFSDTFGNLFESFELMARDALIRLHSNLNVAIKQFLDELNNSGNRTCVLRTAPANPAFTGSALADAYLDFGSVCRCIAVNRDDEE